MKMKKVNNIFLEKTYKRDIMLRQAVKKWTDIKQIKNEKLKTFLKYWKEIYNYIIDDL